jgi:hypothetical protein
MILPVSSEERTMLFRDDASMAHAIGGALKTGDKARPVAGLLRCPPPSILSSSFRIFLAPTRCLQ